MVGMMPYGMCGEQGAASCVCVRVHVCVLRQTGLVDAGDKNAPGHKANLFYEIQAAYEEVCGS